MKLLNVLAAISITASVLFACNSSDEVGNTPGEPMKLKIQLATPVATRADVAPIPTDPYPSVIDKVYYYVVNYQGDVLTHGAFLESEIGSPKTITTTTAAHDVIIVANYPSSFTAASYTSLSQIGAAVMSMADLAPATTVESDGNANDHGVKYAMMYNVEANALVPNTDSGAGENDKKVTVKIAPVAARIEIAGISGTATVPAELGFPLKSFTLSGVYLNNIYPSITLDNYVTAAGTKIVGEDLTGRATWTYDGLGTAAYQGDVEYAPANGVWAYHIAPVSDVADLPQIVLHLTDVVYGDASNDVPATVADLYIVVRGYTLGTSGTGADVEAFVRGKVYKISDIEFNKQHLVTTPEPEESVVTATIQIEGWTFEPITPVV